MHGKEFERFGIELEGTAGSGPHFRAKIKVRTTHFQICLSICLHNRMPACEKKNVA